MALASLTHLQPLFKRLQVRDQITSDEMTALAATAGAIVDVPANTDMAPEGSRPGFSTLVVEGFAIRYNLLGDGRRQITAIHVPGDFIDLPSFLLKSMDHSVAALSDCRVMTYSHQSLLDITARWPHLSRMLWLLTLMEAAIHRQWLVTMGRFSALQRMAHLVCELYVRLETVGKAHNGRFNLPMTHVGLADTLGLSPVHVNRILGELRSMRLIRWDTPEVEILDWAGLRRVAEFDDSYLNLRNEPR